MRVRANGGSPERPCQGCREHGACVPDRGAGAPDGRRGRARRSSRALARGRTRAGVSRGHAFFSRHASRPRGLFHHGSRYRRSRRRAPRAHCHTAGILLGRDRGHERGVGRVRRGAGVPSKVRGRPIEVPRPRRADATGQRHFLGRCANLLRMARQAPPARGRVRESREGRRRSPLSLGKRTADTRQGGVRELPHRGRRHAFGRSRPLRARRSRGQRVGMDGGRVRPLRIPACWRRGGTAGFLPTDYGSAGRASEGTQAGIHGLKPDSRGMRALHTWWCLQLRCRWPALNQPRAPSKPVSYTYAWPSLRQRRLPLSLTAYSTELRFQ
jgi:hypothetical protein